MKTRDQPAMRPQAAYPIAVGAAPQPAAQVAGPVIWKPDARIAVSPTASLPAFTAMLRGAGGRCPACGKGALFSGWLRVSPNCSACDAPLGDIRADDAPPYFTVFIVAHVVIGAQVLLERYRALSVATEMMIFLPGTLLLTLGLLRPVKGATVGLMLKLGFVNTPVGMPGIVRESDDA